MLTDAEADELERLLDERDKDRAEESLYEFVKQAWHVVEPGVPFTEMWHGRTICDHLEAVSDGTIKRLLINIPPRHAKSTLCAVMWPAWEWTRNPSQKYLCASYSSVLSTRDALKTRRLIQSPWYQDRWGHLFSLTGDQNAKMRYDNDKNGYRIATSVGGATTGDGGSRLLLDDAHGAQDAQSDALRETALEWFDTVWSSRLNDPRHDAMVVIMQRLHDQDVSGHILANRTGWEHLCLPAEWDGVRRSTVLGEYDPRTVKGSLLWPERFTPGVLTTLKQSLGEYGAAGQLQQTPLPAAGGILKTSFIKLWPYGKGLPRFEYIIQSYDCAFTEKTTGDPTACTVWGVFTHGETRNAMLIDAWSDHLGYPDLRKRAIDDWGAQYGGDDKASPPVRPRKADRIIVEAKASGQSLLQDLRLANVPIFGYNPGNADKIARAHQASPTLEMGLIWVPESKTLGQPASWAKDFIDEVGKFPVAKHDDYVDTMTQSIIYLRDNGWFELQIADEDEQEEVDYDKKRKASINPYSS